MNLRPLIDGLSHFLGRALGLLLALGISYLLASRVGATGEADAFIIGRRLVTSLGESLNKVFLLLFIPVFVHAVLAGHAQLTRVALLWSALAGSFGAAVAGAVWLGAPSLADAFAPSLDAPSRASAIMSLRVFFIAFPGILMIVVLGYMLNALDRFGTPEVTRQLPRLSILVTLIFSSAFLAVHGAMAFTFATYAVLAILTVMALRTMRSKALPDDADALDDKPRIRGPVVLVLILSNQLGLWLETAYAGRIGEGALTTLELSQRLGALAANTLGSSLFLAIFVHWTVLTRSGRADELSRDAPRLVALSLAGLAMLQAFVFLNAGDLVEAVLGHGAFDAEETATRVVRWISLAPLSMFLLNVVLVRMLVAENRSAWRLFALVMIDICVKIALFELLIPRFDLVGLSAALGLSPLIALSFGPWLLGARLPSGAAFLTPNVRRIALTAVVAVGGLVVGRVLAGAAASAVDPGETMGALVNLTGSALCGVAALAVTARSLKVPLKLGTKKR